MHNDEMTNFYDKKIKALGYRKNIIRGLLIAILFCSVFYAYVSIVVLDKTNISILNEYMDKLEKKDIINYDSEDYRFIISEVVGSNKSVVQETLVLFTVIISLASTALINAFMSTAKQIDDLEEKRESLKQISVKNKRLGTKIRKNKKI